MAEETCFAAIISFKTWWLDKKSSLSSTKVLKEGCEDGGKHFK